MNRKKSKAVDIAVANKKIMDIAKFNILRCQPAKYNTSFSVVSLVHSLGHKHKPNCKITSETVTIETTDLFSFIGYRLQVGTDIDF